MGWVAMPQLVAATSNAGAFGFLALATAGPQEAIEMIDETMSLTNKPFGVNFHMFQPGADEIVQAVLDKKIKAVSYSRSPTPDYIKAFKQQGIICIPTVGALKHAIKAEQLGADALVIQCIIPEVLRRSSTSISSMSIGMFHTLPPREQRFSVCC